MKLKLKILLIISIFFLLPFTVSAKEVTLNLFYGKECPHCEAEQKYLKTLEKKYKGNLKINKIEVWHNEENSELLTKVKNALGDDNNYVPYTVIGTTGITGYNENTENKIEKLITKALKNGSVNAVSYIKEGKEIPKEKTKQDSKFTVPILGKINAKEVSLPILAVVIGLVDGFNPCAMWVLLFLISMLISMKNKKRMWALGLTFLITSAIIYLLFMVAWLSIAINAFQQSILRTIIAAVALIAGIINLNSYIKTKNDPDGCTVVPKNKRQKIFDKIKKFTKEKSFLLAMLGVITLAISVNIVELACSAGLPLLFTSILAMNDLNTFQYGFNLFLYILFFLLDDIIIFAIAMKTLEVTGISTKYSKYSHLIGGIIMTLIGILLVLKPEWIMFNF
ncbi:MAG: hypothetical protein IKG40_03885 [Bacilli bacterium]|nr:hypothetical protein [Bacilli bacterium]